MEIVLFDKFAYFLRELIFRNTKKSSWLDWVAYLTSQQEKCSFWVSFKKF